MQDRVWYDARYEKDMIILLYYLPYIIVIIIIIIRILFVSYVYLSLTLYPMTVCVSNSNTVYQ